MRVSDIENVLCSLYETTKLFVLGKSTLYDLVDILNTDLVRLRCEFSSMEGETQLAVVRRGHCGVHDLKIERT